MSMKQTALTLELRQDNPNIICRWDEHGVSHHKELSFKMMGTLIDQAVQYEPIFTGLLPPKSPSPLTRHRIVNGRPNFGRKLKCGGRKFTKAS